MGLETGVTYIEDLNDLWPIGSTDTMDEVDNHLRNVKTAVQGSFPNLGAAAVTCTAAELNYNDITTLGTVQASKTVTADANGFINIPTGKGLGDANGNEALIVTTTASAVNELTVTNAATTNPPAIAATGGDTNIDLHIDAKGSGDIVLNGTATGTVTLPANSITNTQLADDVVTSAEVDWTIGSSGSQSVGTGGWVIPEGLVNIVPSGTNPAAYLEIYESATWRRSPTYVNGCVWSDGTNMRLITSASSITVYYQVLA